MSSMLVGSSGDGKYFLGVDFPDGKHNYINTPEEIRERMAACLRMYNEAKQELESHGYINDNEVTSGYSGE